MDEDLHCSIAYELSIDLECTRKPSQEDRGSFGGKSVLGLEGYRRDLPGAQNEVESIALILNTIPQ